MSEVVKPKEKKVRKKKLVKEHNNSLGRSGQN